MSMISNPIIMKQNPLILAEFEKAFSEVDHDVVNILLNELQNVFKIEENRMDLFNYEKVLDRKIIIPASRFKELGKFGVNATDNIFNSLKKISDTSAVVRNFVDHNNKPIKAKTIRLIDDVTLYERGALYDKREQAFEIQFNEWFLQIGNRHYNVQVGNYTKLDLTCVSSIKGKHAKTLYELLLSKEHRGTSFSLKLIQLQKLFGLKDKPLSQIVAIIKRVQPKVSEHIDFEYTVFKKDKMISFKYL